MKEKTLDLNVNDILIAEFNYAMSTASQSNEDRVKIFQFIVANLFTLGATVLFSFFNQDQSISLLGYIFLLFLVLGVLFLIQLSRLRLAWIESVKAMNVIKNFYIKHNPELSEAFIWRLETIPRANKQISLAHLLALSIIFLNAISFGLGISLITNLSGGSLLAISSGTVAIVFQIILWNSLLK